MIGSPQHSSAFNGRTIAVFVLAAALYLGHACYLDSLMKHVAYDDAYISFRYAENLVEGRGLVYNEGERVEGFTNPAWVAVAAGAIAAGADPVAVSKILGLGCGLLAMLFIALLPRRNGTDPVFGAAWPLLPLAAGATLPSSAVSGLETTAWLSAICGALYFFARAAESKRPKELLCCSIALAAAALIRSDGFVATALLAAIAAAFFPGFFGDRRRAAALLGPALLAVAALFSFRYLYYGQLLPNTYYAKVDVGLGARLRSGGAYLLKFALVYGVYFLVLAYPARRRLSAPVSRIYLPFGLLFSLYLLWVGGDFPYLYRFTLPIAACAYVALAEAFSGRAEAPAGRKPAAGAWLFTPVFMVIVFLGSFFLGEDLLVHRPGALLDYDRVRLGKWMKDHVPPEATVAVKAAGQIPYYSGLRTVDFYGLTDPQVRRWPVGDGVYGHRRYSIDYLIGKNPELVAGVFEELSTVAEFRAGWVLATPELLAGVNFWVRRDYFDLLKGVKLADEKGGRR